MRITRLDFDVPDDAERNELREMAVRIGGQYRMDSSYVFPHLNPAQVRFAIARFMRDPNWIDVSLSEVVFSTLPLPRPAAPVNAMRGSAAALMEAETDRRFNALAELMSGRYRP